MFDDLIETVEDTFEDVGKKVKNLDKKKIFIIACVVVFVIGLFVFMQKRKTTTTASEEVVVGGIGAGDIPFTSGSDIDLAYEGLVDEYNETLGDLASDYNNELLSLEQNYKDQLVTMEDSYTIAIEENKKYYSDELALLNESVAEIEAEKESLTKSIGSYDNNINYTQEIKDLMADGESGSSSKVTDLVISRASKISNEGLSKYQTDYDKNVDYMSAINKAKEEGASQEVIDTLTAQREAKIKGEKLTQYYGDLKQEK